MKNAFVRYFIVSAVGLLLIVSCKNKKPEVSGRVDDIYYTCSMDPQVVEAKPGKCPICHMELTAVKKSAQQKNDNELELSPEQMQLGNIQVDTIHDGAMGNQMVLTGTLTFDQTRISTVSSRVEGRIERLYFKNIGDFVSKGARLFDLYSEALNNAKQEYLLAVQKRKILGNTVIDFDQVIESAKNKLHLWGLSEAQISSLQNDGDNTVTSFYSTESGYITNLNVQQGEYVSEGATIVQLAGLSTLWVEAQVYTAQLSQLNKSAKATVSIPDMPGREMEGEIEFVNPEINPETRINLIRIKIDNYDHQLKPGMAARVVLRTVKQKTLSLPVNAVLRNGKMDMIWVQVSQNKFMSRTVETGSEGNGLLEIKSGLKDGDAVVINGAYLLQSEYVFRKGASPMAGMDMGGMK